MNNILVSVIIPVYNVEKYLKEAIESVINQTFKNIEIICVNDASPDNCAQILADYASKDARIKIITHNTNRGLSCARNSGLDIAKGEYIYFLDSDDYYDTTLIEKTLKLFSDEIDIVTFNLKKFYELDERNCDITYSSERNCNRNYSREQQGIHKVDNKIYEIIMEESCRNVFKNSLIKKYNIRFAENLIFEDTSFIFKYLAVCRNIFIDTEILYNYRIRTNSILDSIQYKPPVAHRLKNLTNYVEFLKLNKITQKESNDFFVSRIWGYYTVDMGLESRGGGAFGNRLCIVREIHCLLKHYKINKNNTYLNKQAILTLYFLKAPCCILFVIFYKLDKFIKKLFRYKHSHKLL